MSISCRLRLRLAASASFRFLSCSYAVGSNATGVEDGPSPLGDRTIRRRRPLRCPLDCPVASVSEPEDAVSWALRLQRLLDWERDRDRATAAVRARLAAVVRSATLGTPRRPRGRLRAPAPARRLLLAAEESLCSLSLRTGPDARLDTRLAVDRRTEPFDRTLLRLLPTRLPVPLALLPPVPLKGCCTPMVAGRRRLTSCRDMSLQRVRRVRFSATSRSWS